MTTGRINQVTIVRRGRPAGAVFHAPERLSKLLVGALFFNGGRCTRGRHLPAARPGGDRPVANPLYPSMFPRASVHTHLASACLRACGVV